MKGPVGNWFHKTLRPPAFKPLAMCALARLYNSTAGTTRLKSCNTYPISVYAGDQKARLRQTSETGVSTRGLVRGSGLDNLRCGRFIFLDGKNVDGEKLMLLSQSSRLAFRFFLVASGKRYHSRLSHGSVIRDSFTPMARIDSARMSEVDSLSQ